MMFLHFPAACRGNPTSYFKFNSYKIRGDRFFFSAAEWFLGMLHEKWVYLPVLKKLCSQSGITYADLCQILRVTCKNKVIAFEILSMCNLTVGANQHLQTKDIWSMIWRQKSFAAVHASTILIYINSLSGNTHYRMVQVKKKKLYILKSGIHK